MSRRRNERTYRKTIRDREGEERDRAVLQEGFGVIMEKAAMTKSGHCCFFIVFVIYTAGVMWNLFLNACMK